MQSLRVGLNDYPFSAGLLTPPQTFAFLITNFICGSPLQLYVATEFHKIENATTHKSVLFIDIFLCPTQTRITNHSPQKRLLGAVALLLW